MAALYRTRDDLADWSWLSWTPNLLSLIEDFLQTGETSGTRNRSFNAVWFSKARFTPEGFVAEEMSPFKSLRFPPAKPGEEVMMGIGFKRNIPRKNEEISWPFVRSAEPGRV
jgi:hypothetical protein